MSSSSLQKAFHSAFSKQETIETARKKLAAAAQKLEKAGKDEQFALLSGPDVAAKMAYFGQAASVMKAVQGFDKKQQAELLALPGVIEGLGHNGQAVPVIDILETLKKPQQVRALSAPYAVWALMNASTLDDLIKYPERAPRVVKMIENFGKRDQAKVLGAQNAVWGFVEAFYGGTALKLVASFGKAARRDLFSRPNVTEALEAYSAPAQSRTPKISVRRNNKT